VIDQTELENPAGFDKSASEAKIGFRRGWIASYAACGIADTMPYPLLCLTKHGVPSDWALPDAACLLQVKHNVVCLKT
jgi:hypothetical protein